MVSIPNLVAESISASSGASEKQNLLTLQSKMKSDAEGYTSELNLIYKQFKSSMGLFLEQAALSFTSISGASTDLTVSKDLSDRVMFLAHVTPWYPKELANFPNELVAFLDSSAKNLPSGLRIHAAQALILLVNRKIVDISDTLIVFMELQTVGDKELKNLAFSHVIHSIKRMNQKHKNDPKNRALQTILFRMLQQEDEAKAKQALIILCDLHRRRVWFDDRTANAICMACFHSSKRIMNAALSFLLDFEKIQDDDSDDSGSEEEQGTPQTHVVMNKEAIYKANHKGTKASKKKKKAKLERVARSMKKQQRLSSEKNNTNYNSPLNHLKDAQGFAEKLFKRLKNEQKIEIKLMMVKLIARTIGLHQLILIEFYDHLQPYMKNKDQYVVEFLAAAVQSCHDMVPPDAVKNLFMEIVNNFVHDRSRPEAISVGLNVVREICLRMPLLMTEDLLQDLVLYRKSNEKAVSSSARSLLSLFREICPSLLVKKDRGRPADPKAKPKEFGETHVSTSIPGLDLLDQGDSDDDEQEIDGATSDNNDQEDDSVSLVDEDGVSLTDENGSDESDGDSELEFGDSDDELNVGSEEEVKSDSDGESEDIDEDESNLVDTDNSAKKESEASSSKSKGKRKFSDFEGQLNAASNSLRALKKLAGETGNATSDTNDGILSNEDFKRIKELKAKQDARDVLARHGFKVPSSDKLSTKRVDADTLQVDIRKKMTKAEKMELVRAGREDRGQYQAKTALKKKKTGGLSNRQKEHKKAMPLAAKRSKIAKGRIQKKKTARRAGTQFRGRKAWK